jgi:hypothetical protein
MNLHHCGKCGHQGPSEDFYRQTKSKSGRSSYCKKCHNVAASRKREEAETALYGPKIKGKPRRGYNVRWVKEPGPGVTRFSSLLVASLG